jgi:hypothetical protein
MGTARCVYEGSLVREAQDGNEVAFAQLVRTHDEAVLRLALRITGSESDAQDIYQEVFLKVCKEAGSLSIRVFVLYVDISNRDQYLPGSSAKNSNSQGE